MKHTIAIDPGKNGAIAWRDGDSLAHCVPMPETEGDVLAKLLELNVHAKSNTVTIEDVGGWGMPGPRAFTFGRGFGFMLGVCATLNMRVELVRPQKWQKFFSLGSRATAGSKKQWKLKLLSEAQRRFPTADATLDTADALLLLDYAEKNNQ